MFWVSCACACARYKTFLIQTSLGWHVRPPSRICVLVVSPSLRSASGVPSCHTSVRHTWYSNMYISHVYSQRSFQARMPSPPAPIPPPPPLPVVSAFLSSNSRLPKGRAHVCVVGRGIPLLCGGGRGGGRGRGRGRARAPLAVVGRFPAAGVGPQDEEQGD